MAMEDGSILDEILKDTAEKPTMYHITIESSEDGTILDAEVPEVVFLYPDHEGYGGLTMRARGVSGYTLWGWLQWAIEAHKVDMLSGTVDPGPLPFEEEPDGD